MLLLQIVAFSPAKVPTVLMILWPKVRTCSWVRFIRAPPCRDSLFRRLWSSSNVRRKGRFLKDSLPSSEMLLWLKPGWSAGRNTFEHYKTGSLNVLMHLKSERCPVAWLCYCFKKKKRTISLLLFFFCLSSAIALQYFYGAEDFLLKFSGSKF